MSIIPSTILFRIRNTLRVAFFSQMEDISVNASSFLVTTTPCATGMATGCTGCATAVAVTVVEARSPALALLFFLQQQTMTTMMITMTRRTTAPPAEIPMMAPMPSPACSGGDDGGDGGAGVQLKDVDVTGEDGGTIRVLNARRERARSIVVADRLRVSARACEGPHVDEW